MEPFLGILLLIAAEIYIGMSIYAATSVGAVFFSLQYLEFFSGVAIGAYVFLIVLFITWQSNKKQDVEVVEKFKNRTYLINFITVFIWAVLKGINDNETLGTIILLSITLTLMFNSFFLITNRYAYDKLREECEMNYNKNLVISYRAHLIIGTAVGQVSIVASIT